MLKLFNKAKVIVLYFIKSTSICIRVLYIHFYEKRFGDSREYIYTYMSKLRKKSKNSFQYPLT